MAKSSVAFEALAPGLWRRRGLTCLVDTNGRSTTYDETRPIILPERLHGECGLQSTLDHFLGEALAALFPQGSYAFVVCWP